ncbi:MAG: hypothetical protein HYR96_09975 [Deltaproteobacteria bacterium]|nr:hypothetical protein [Deltaproteobacteria bacterium]MBI3296057.1 hypothetical protein [Deltaproteobacteria bacterium]
MKALLWILLGLLSASSEAAPSGTIVQIAHRLPMSGAEKPLPRDFYVDLGAKHGLKEGDKIQVSRLIPVMQSMSGQPASLVRLPMGEAAVLRVSDFVSLARTTQLVPPSQLPSMNYYQFMLGDTVTSLIP